MDELELPQFDWGKLLQRLRPTEFKWNAQQKVDYVVRKLAAEAHEMDVQAIIGMDFRAEPPEFKAMDADNKAVLLPHQVIVMYKKKGADVEAGPMFAPFIPPFPEKEKEPIAKTTDRHD
jgi:hypothetical protein